jgi:hypothetical protein
MKRQGNTNTFPVLAVLLVLALPLSGWSQFTFITNNGAITITGYAGSGGAAVIPSTINGWTVASIGDYAFSQVTNVTLVSIPDSVISIGNQAFLGCSGLTNLTIGNGVTNIGTAAFQQCVKLRNVAIGNGVINLGDYTFQICGSLTSVIIPNSVTSIGDFDFNYCSSLTNVTIGNSVTSIGKAAFQECTSLTSVTIPGSVTNIVDDAFLFCVNLKGLYFKGNAPSFGFCLFCGGVNATNYYLPGISGWTNTFAGLPAVLWNPLAQTSDGSFGVQNNKFGFNITGTTNIPIVVEACTNFASLVWQPLQTSTVTNGSIYFSDPAWTNYPSRFYRIRSP